MKPDIPNIQDLAGRSLLVVGDLMIDEYVWGSVDRISPEAPVQILEVTRESYTLGGAGNVVNNLSVLGARVSISGVIGPGADGARLMEMFGVRGVDAEGVIVEPERPTTRKTRIIAAHQQMLRIDRETRREISDATFDKLRVVVAERIPRSDAVLVSDYGKGVVTRSFFRHIAETARQAGKPLIVDPKGRDYSKYAGASLVTPNKKEAALAADMDIQDTDSLHEAARRILSDSWAENLLVTCGPEGMVLYEKGRPPLFIQADAKQVFDVSGAGDTVLSVMGVALAAGLPYPKAAALANTAAGIVVGKVGTATVTPDELAAALQPSLGEVIRKQKSLEALANLTAEMRQRGRRVVLTNGCFDLLHAGHIQLFSAARGMGDALIVAIDDDASIRRLKGPGRPVLTAAERVKILSAIDSVDFVTVFASEDLGRLIDTLKPDVLAKGSNYAPEEVKGHERVAAYGGRIALVPVTEAVTSTGIINSIRENRTP